MFKIFGDCADQLNFQKALIHLSQEDNEEATKKIVGAQIHEIFKICIEKDWDVFLFTMPLVNTLNSNIPSVFLSPLENLSMSI